MVTKKSISEEQMKEILHSEFQSSLRTQQKPESVDEDKSEKSQEDSPVYSPKEREDIPEVSKETSAEEETAQSVQRRVSGRQRRLSLEEYRNTFLRVPKIEDRKPVFVSCEVRDRLDEYVRKLGGRKMSVSGLIENIVREHLKIYDSDFEQWRKL